MYEHKNYEHLLGLTGFSDELLTNHFTLYEGYVKNFNKLNDALVEIEKAGQYETPQFNELNRRLGWEFNGMRLHEYYFGNLTKVFKEIESSSKLKKAIKKEFGSYEFFEKDFKAMGAMRGIGWVILYHDPKAERLFNVWINEHDTGHFVGCTPILVMDVFEHAYMLDYGTKRPGYVDSFFKAIDWREVEKRFK